MRSLGTLPAASSFCFYFSPSVLCLFLYQMLPLLLELLGTDVKLGCWCHQSLRVTRRLSRRSALSRGEAGPWVSGGVCWAVRLRAWGTVPTGLWTAMSRAFMLSSFFLLEARQKHGLRMFLFV